MTFGERRHLDRIIGDKGGLYVMAFAFLAEYFVDDFSFAHCFVDLDPDFFANFAQLCFVHAADVDTRVFLDSVEHSDTLERSFEIDRVFTDFDLGSTVYVETDFF